MSRPTMFVLFYLANFLQAGAYGLTFLLPRLFSQFGANEKVVGFMLLITTISTLVTVYYAGHLSDHFGRMRTLGFACMAIAAALLLYGVAPGVGVILYLASALLGAGWGATYALAPIVLTRLVKPDERVSYFAVLAVAIMAGFGLSPVLAAMLESTGLTVNHAFFITAVLCAIAGFIFLFLIEVVRARSDTAGTESRSGLSLAAIAQVVRSPALLPVIMVAIGASVFAGMNNFQTVIADKRGLNYSDYFLAYTITVVIFRLALARFKGGNNPYRTIALLQYIMCGAVLLFIVSDSSNWLYILTAILFGIGYGVSYPVLAAMAANDAEPHLLAQTLQLFALTYFIGIFGFPMVAGWLIVEVGAPTMLVLVALLAALEASMALFRAWRRTSATH